MRTIKFRAWDTLEKEMLSFYVLEKQVYNILGHMNSISGSNWIYMQFTGLLDKNGKEIYEGDIVKFYETTLPEDYDVWNAVPMVCEFKDNGFNFYGKEDSRTGSLDNDDKEFREIIGNIYENSDLLE